MGKGGSAVSVEFAKYHRWKEHSNAMHFLRGLLAGLGADGVMSSDETAAVRVWLERQGELVRRAPFSEIAGALEEALEDGCIVEDEREALVWLIDRLDPGVHCAATAGKQALCGMLGGMTADGRITADELRVLQGWLEEHEGLRRSWPYDEIESLVTKTIADGVVSPEEEEELLQYFGVFAMGGVGQVLDDGAAFWSLAGICACDPEITVEGHRFCLTGDSGRMLRRDFEAEIAARGGIVLKGVRKDLDYLVVGSEGSPCWGLSLYGHKIEKAMEYRRRGLPLMIVHENDFWDAV